MEMFGQSLLNDTNPPIPGLDESVLISPRRLHFTLGVMSLAGAASSADREGLTRQPRTVDDAVRFLQSLKPRVEELLRSPVSGTAGQGQKVRIALNSMDVMNLERGGTAHVLWVGPEGGNSKDIPDEMTNQIRQVCGTLNDLSRRAQKGPLICLLAQISFTLRSEGLDF
jgi:hypothetical protein